MRSLEEGNGRLRQEGGIGTEGTRISAGQSGSAGARGGGGRRRRSRRRGRRRSISALLAPRGRAEISAAHRLASHRMATAEGSLRGGEGLADATASRWHQLRLGQLLVGLAPFGRPLVRIGRRLRRLLRHCRRLLVALLARTLGPPSIWLAGPTLNALFKTIWKKKAKQTRRVKVTFTYSWSASPFLFIKHSHASPHLQALPQVDEHYCNGLCDTFKKKPRLHSLS
jgi:hypothetical protein